MPSYGEFMTTFAKTVAERTKPGQRQDVEEQSTLSSRAVRAEAVLTRIAGYTFHAYGRTEGVAGIIISDKEYPALVAHQLLSKVVDEFLSKHPRTAYAAQSPGALAFPELRGYIDKYQDPHQADSIMKIQRELDETKIVLHKTIESVLERGEKIDTLVEKSNDLSSQSKMFYSKVRFATIVTLVFASLFLQACKASRLPFRNATSSKEPLVPRAVWLARTRLFGDVAAEGFLASVACSRYTMIIGLRHSVTTGQEAELVLRRYVSGSEQEGGKLACVRHRQSLPRSKICTGSIGSGRLPEV